MIVPESDEVATEALLRNDFGPDLCVTLPREHWVIVGTMVEVLGEMLDARLLDSDAVTPFTEMTGRMREYAAFVIRRACGRSFLADARAMEAEADE